MSEGSEPDSLGEFEQFFDKPGQERVEDLVFSVSKLAA